MRILLFYSALVAILAAPPVVAGGAREFQVAPVVSLSDGTTKGAAWLKRGNNEVEGRIMTDVGMSGVPVTVWWLVWDKPGQCENPIFDPDGNLRALCNPSMGDSPSAVIFASSAIAASDGLGSGVLNARMRLVAGEEAGGEGPCCRGLLPRGKGRTSEIHLVVEKHDPPGMGGTTWAEELTVPRGGAIRGVPFLPATMPRQSTTRRPSLPAVILPQSVTRR